MIRLKHNIIQNKGKKFTDRVDLCKVAVHSNAHIQAIIKSMVPNKLNAE